MPVWWPSNVDSLITSRHHTNMVNNNIKKLLNKIILPCLYACIYKTPPVVHEKAVNAEIKGHGLGSTRWKGCLCKFLDIFDDRIILIFFFVWITFF